MQKVFEHYVIEKTIKDGVTFEVETDCITYDEKDGMIISWGFWSNFYSEFICIDLDKIESMRPEKYEEMVLTCKNLAKAKRLFADAEQIERDIKDMKEEAV